MLQEATQNIIRLEELLAQRDEEIKNQQSFIEGLQVEFEDANHIFKATTGRNKALLGLLSQTRKSYRDTSKELSTMRSLYRATRDTVSFMSITQSSNEMLYQEIEAHKSRADDYSAVLNKIAREADKVDPPVPGSSQMDPRNLKLQAWHAEEIALRQEIIELRVEATLQARLQASAREKAVLRRLSESAAVEFDIGYSEGYARGKKEAARNITAIDNVDDQIDEFLKGCIAGKGVYTMSR